MTHINNQPIEEYKRAVEVHANHFITTLETMSVFITPEDTSEEFDAAFALAEMGVAKIIMKNDGEMVGMWLTRALTNHNRFCIKFKKFAAKVM